MTKRLSIIAVVTVCLSLNFFYLHCSGVIGNELKKELGFGISAFDSFFQNIDCNITPEYLRRWHYAQAEDAVSNLKFFVC